MHFLILSVRVSSLYGRFWRIKTVPVLKGLGWLERGEDFPISTRRWPNVGLVLCQRRRQWANIYPPLGQRLVFVGFQVWNDAHSGPVDVWAANTTPWTNVVFLLAHRLRRWTNIETALAQAVVFAGWVVWQGGWRNKATQWSGWNHKQERLR